MTNNADRYVLRDYYAAFVNIMTGIESNVVTCELMSFLFGICAEIQRIGHNGEVISAYAMQTIERDAEVFARDQSQNQVGHRSLKLISEQHVSLLSLNQIASLTRKLNKLH
jgi:hypothetical protein